MSDLRARPRLLCFVAYYLPGYRSGGPVRTIANFVEQLGHEFDIFIVTRDRDMLDTEQYPHVTVDDWNTVRQARVFYASDQTLTLRAISRLLRNTPHDLLYVNSFFDPLFTGLPLLARRLGMAPSNPCVIAPRGEFSSGAIALKAWKKTPYLLMSKQLGLYKELHWQASSLFEVADIARELGSIAQWVYVAPDLTSSVIQDLNVAPARTPGPLRLVFLSRISPKKNLDFLLRVLRKVSANLELAIYGPQENLQYWEQCKALINLIPNNISVTVREQVPHEQVRDVFAAHDLFVFPTHGENFGHVVFESLSVGTPVLVSDQTPWQPDEQGGLKVLVLDEIIWVDVIEGLARLDKKELTKLRKAASKYSYQYSIEDNSCELSRKLFRTAIGRV